MGTKTILTRAGEMLTGKSKSTAATIRDTRREIADRIDAIDQRLKAITGEGKVRRDVLLSGTTDGVLKLDAEAEQLRAEQKSLRERSKALARDLEGALDREAEQNAPAMRKEALDAAAEVVRAREALDAATGRLTRAKSDIDAAQRRIGDVALFPNLADAERVAAAMVDPSKRNRTLRLQESANGVRSISEAEHEARKLTRKDATRAPANRPDRSGIHRTAGMVRE